MRRFLLSCLGVLLISSTALSAQRISADGGVQTFSVISEQYFSDVYYHFAPTLGTAAGLHQYDPQLEDYSEANIKRQVTARPASAPSIPARSMPRSPLTDRFS
jgi:hypothetical protein